MTLPPCPWCGDEIDDTPEEIPFFEDISIVDCADCGKSVIIHRVIEFIYTVTAGSDE